MIGRWTKAYPGVAKVVHFMGPMPSEADAVRAFETQFRPRLAGLAEDQAHPKVRSLGYGDERKFWTEVHFAKHADAKAYQAEFGGVIWDCVALNQNFDKQEYRSAEKFVETWLTEHQAVVPGKQLVVDVIENQGRSSFTDEETPTAYVYINDSEAAMMLKLALGGAA